MNKLICIGELLIDFTGTKAGTFATIPAFQKNPGGAPANVAVCASRLGAKTEFITKLGTDPFGDYLLSVLRDNGVGAAEIRRTDKANTPLAFVALDKGGERGFSFYRNPSSDLFLSAGDIRKGLFERGDILHFGSVDLVDFPVKGAHRAALDYAKAAGCLISFDPNLRYPLWKSKEALIRAVNEFLPYADIVKLGDDELPVITEEGNEEKAVKKLFEEYDGVKIIVVTYGKRGARAYFANGGSVYAEAFKVKQTDATGAGDAFVGALLFQLLRDGKTPENIAGSTPVFPEYLKYANKAASIVVTRRGAIAATPYFDEVFKE